MERIDRNWELRRGTGRKEKGQRRAETSTGGTRAKAKDKAEINLEKERRKKTTSEEKSGQKAEKGAKGKPGEMQAGKHRERERGQKQGRETGEGVKLGSRLKQRRSRGKSSG